jgi:hypothetical protein
MVDSANASLAGDSEFAESGLTPIASVKIAAPRVKGFRSTSTASSNAYFSSVPTGIPLLIGEVVYIHVDPARVTNGSIDMKKLNPIAGSTAFSTPRSATFSNASFSTVGHANGSVRKRLASRLGMPRGDSPEALNFVILIGTFCFLSSSGRDSSHPLPAALRTTALLPQESPR